MANPLQHVNCWVVALNLGPELGVHFDVPIIRYKQQGPIFMDVTHVESIFRVSRQELTSSLTSTRGTLFCEESRPHLIQHLQSKGFPMGKASNSITLIKVSTIKKAMLALDKPPSSILALEDLAKSNPSNLPPTMEPLHHPLPSPTWNNPTSPSPSPTPTTHHQQQEVQHHTINPQQAIITTTTTTPPTTTSYTFPTSLPPTTLTPPQVKERYGFEEASTPPKLKHELQCFSTWSKEDFNFTRGRRYSNSVQEDTLTNQLQCMRAFCGYITKYFHGDMPSSATIYFYKDPQYLASFVAYLKARGAQRGHLIKHISLAKKVNFYLKATCPTTSTSTSTHVHFNKLDEWLATMELQVSQAVPSSSTTRPRVDGDKVLRWASQLGSKAVAMVEVDMQMGEGLSWQTSSLVHGAIVASLVVGAHVPPLRLNLIKTLNHPKYLQELKCTDKDCKRGDSCLGNHLKEVVVTLGVEGDGDGDGVHEVVQEEEDWPYFGYNTTNLVLVVAHGKNDRRGVGVDLEFTLPRGDLTKLMLAHIHMGHEVLTLSQHLPQTRLFVKPKGGNAFTNDSTFTQMWESLLVKCPIANGLGITYFPPMEARRMFVEEYTSMHGVGPSLWDGAAYVMGNSTRQWEATYNPSRKQRRAQEAVDAHSSFVNKRHHQEL